MMNSEVLKTILIVKYEKDENSNTRNYILELLINVVTMFARKEFQ